MNRDLELRIKGHLYEITATNDDAIDSRQGFPAAIEGYKRTLESVAECAGAELVDTVAEKIKTEIQSREDRPANQSIRRWARKRLSEEGFVLDTYLNNA